MTNTLDDFEQVKCLICGVFASESLANTNAQHGFPVHVVICTQCGLVYLNPRWTKARYQSFYAEEYDSHFRNPFTEEHTAGVSTPTALTFEQETAEVAFTRLREANLMPRTVKTLLDVGSGSGGFIQQARQIFPDVACAAIEPSANCVPLLLSAGVDHLSTDVDSNWDANYKDTFDFIYMRHVLEHFLNPLVTLHKIKDVLTENGLVYIAVPNGLDPDLPVLKSHFRVVHTYYFSRGTLQRLLGMAGLVPQLVIEGDKWNRHELVIVAKPGTPTVRESSTYLEHREVLRKHIEYEQSMPYRARKAMRAGKHKLRRVARRFI